MTRSIDELPVEEVVAAWTPTWCTSTTSRRGRA